MSYNNLWKPDGFTPNNKNTKPKKPKSFRKKNKKKQTNVVSLKPHQKKIKEVQSLSLKPYSHPDLGKEKYNAFYKSTEWKQLRYLALSNSEGRCQCCGARASDGVTMHVDHIKPRSRYPKLELSLDNVQVLCSDCNQGKGDWGLDDWRSHWKSI